MDYHQFKAVLNRYFSRHVGGSRRPVFFNIEETYPALNHVTRHFSVIRDEFERLMQSNLRVPRYHEVDAGERAISATTAHNWNVFMLEILGHRPEVNRVRCPETCRVLDSVPNKLQAFFSILDPGKSIPLHEGPYLGYLRYHLALRVPRDNPPKIVVNGQSYTWREGEAVLFDDSWPHEVINHSANVRAVLIVDVLRPMPWLPSLVNRLTAQVIARHTYGRKVARKAIELADQPAEPLRRAA